MPLFVVATPIGNLEDITYRAVRVLSEAELIAAEDTRSARTLLARYNIRTPLCSYHEHNEEAVAARLAERLGAGAKIALISESGTPLISDPGYRIVRRAIEAGVEVVPIPGPCALTAALSVAGLPVHEFTFRGFLPRRAGQRRTALELLRDHEGTLIFYESPYRVRAMLADALSVLGDRPAAVGRELTKLHEEMIRGTLSELANRDFATRGEFVVLIAGRRRVAGAAP